MSTSGVFSTLGGTMSTLGNVQYIGGYHEYIGGYYEYTGGCSERFLPTCSPTCIMISPNVLNILRCTHEIPHMHHDIPQFTEHPLCTNDIPPMYRTSPPPPPPPPPPDVLNSHYTVCKGFRKIGLPNPVITAENSADNNPIHTTLNKSVHTTCMVSNPLLKNIRRLLDPLNCTM